MKRTVCFILLLVLAAVLPFTRFGCGIAPRTTHKKMLVMGFDGMDPVRVRRLMMFGKMPNLSRLAIRGGFRELATSVPPQSPVAWSNFITGANGGTHGIFDFIHRKRSPTTGLFDPLDLYFSTSEVRPGAEPFKVGDYLVPRPWSASENVLLRGGHPFWDFLDQQAIPVRMYHLPANFPPSKSGPGHACCLSGMGTPDVLASQGTYQYFSRDTDVPYGGETPGGGRRMRIKYKKDIQTATLIGPKNPFRAGTPDTELDLSIFPDDTNEAALIEWSNPGLLSDDHHQVLLNVGEWSDWQPIVFQTVPWIQPGGVPAICKFYLKQVHPKVRLYVSPLNFDPRAPAIAFSEPPSFATHIADEVGPYATIGFAEAFKALSHKTLTDEEFHQQALSVLSENERILDQALHEYVDGLLFFYFSSSDLMAHMFWWDGSGKHPTRTPANAKKYNAAIDDLYIRLDADLGRAWKAVGDDATVVVLSDHGFNNWSREFNLNNWLRDNGYINKQPGATDWPGLSGKTDWSGTRAYGVGLNGLCINLSGREAMGCVANEDKRALEAEISRKLLALIDPRTGQHVVQHVYRAEEVYAGPHLNDAPDLIVGYNRGYRVSGESGLGNFEKEMIFDNTDAWSADHCIAAELVPGIVAANRPITLNAPALTDLAPTILAEFGIAQPEQMKGRSIFSTTAVARR